MKILVLIAIVGIGYLLYRSLVIKRESDTDTQPTGDIPPAETETQLAARNDSAADVTTQPSVETSTASNEAAVESTSERSPPGGPSAANHSAVKQADITSDVGQEAERAAVNAQAKAVEKAHHQQALDAKHEGKAHQQEALDAKQVPQARDHSLTEASGEEALQEAPASDVVQPVPEQIAAQVGALQEVQEPLARHRLYQQIVDLSYRQRSDERYRDALHLFAPAHIDEFSSIAPLLKTQNGGKLPQVTTFKHYAAALTEAEQYDEAIAVCEQAREYGLKDGTKSGYVGRIERINKLKARDAAN